MTEIKQLDILGSNAVPVNLDVVIILTKENSENIEQETKQKCKILKFSSEWKFDEILSTISRLESQIYPRLFIFIIGDANLELVSSKTEENEKKFKLDVEILQKNLLKFDKNRSMILQLTSIDENATKFFYKEENSEEFYDIKEQDAETSDFNDFPTFFRLLMNKKIDISAEVIIKLLGVKNSTLILRFIGTLKIYGEIFGQIIFYCAAFGTKFDIFVAINGKLDENGGIEGTLLKFFVKFPYYFNSIIIAVLRHSNKEMLEFLMKNCINLIKKVPFERSALCSKTVYEKDQFDVLCDLLELCDFPFPDELNPESITDERLRRIVDARVKFHADVLAENLSEIERFLKNNSNLKFAYDLKNQPAFRNALDSKKFKSFTCLMQTLCQTLDAEDLKGFILQNKIFVVSIVSSKMDLNAVEEVIEVIKNKTDSKFINEALKMREWNGHNLFFKLVQSEGISIQRLQGFLQIMQKFLDAEQIINLMSGRNTSFGFSVLHYCAWNENTRQLVILFTVFKTFFISSNVPHKFRELIGEKGSFNHENILHIASHWQNKESHQTLWRLLLKNFENREELKDLIMQNERNGINFVHYLVIFSNADILEYTLKKIKENLNEAQYEEILKSKGYSERNLLHYAANRSKNIEMHQILWKFFQDFCKSDEKFLKFLKEVDKGGCDVLQLAACFSTKEIFEFMVKKLEKLTSLEEVKIFLSMSREKDQNLFQLAAKHNKSLEFHQKLWKIIEKYYEPSEVLEMIKHADNIGNNLLYIATLRNTKEILEFIWNEIKNAFGTNGDAALLEFLQCVNIEGANILHALVNHGNKENMKYFWTELENYFASQNSSHQFKELLSQQVSGMESCNILHFTADWDDIESHETLWRLLLNTFEDRAKLKDLVMQKEKNGYNFVHFLTTYDNTDIIEFTLGKIKDNFSDAQYQEILKSKGLLGRNLLQVAAHRTRYIGTHEMLWNIFKNSCKSDAEFLEILHEVDGKNDDLLRIASSSATCDVFDFIIEEFRKLLSVDELKEAIQTLGQCDGNLLHSATAQNKLIETHQKLWEIIEKDLNFSEILQLIIHCDKDGNTILHNAVFWNTKSIAEFTWNKIKAFITTKNGQVEYLNRKGQRGQNIYEMCLENKAKDPQMRTWIENLMNEFKKTFTAEAPHIQHVF